MSNNNITINTEQSAMPVQDESKSLVINHDESKPVENIWNKRLEDVSKLQKQSKETNFLNVNSESETIVGKGSGKGYKNYGKGSGKGSGKGYGKGKGKGYQPRDIKDLSPEEKLFREEKTKAFNLAQDTAIKMCVDCCNSKVREEVNSSISYEMNYRRILVMDITEDDIVVDVEGNKHVYSLRRFLENRYFQNNVREEYVKLLPEAWIRFFVGRDEGTFCIGIQKKKE
jgi:hypothetical protein